MLGLLINPTLQLLVARWYPGAPFRPAEADSELDRRGWSFISRFAARLMLLLLLAPDRLVARLDPALDHGEETGAPREVVASMLLSLFLVSVLGLAVSAYAVVSAHDSGRPYSWSWSIGFLASALLTGLACRLVSRQQA